MPLPHWQNDGKSASLRIDDNGKLIKQNNDAEDYDTDEYRQLNKI